MAARLEAAGADFLVIPCNTAHVFEDKIQAAVSIPLISIIDATVTAIGDRCPGADAAGVLATSACLRADVYQKALNQAGIRSLLPDKDEIDTLTILIGKIKAGDKGEDVSNAMLDLANALVERGAQAIIAGCTEIPLVLDDESLAVPLISSTDMLAQKTVALARGEEPLPNQE
jgi:aspartate racemase